LLDDPAPDLSAGCTLTPVFPEQLDFGIAPRRQRPQSVAGQHPRRIGRSVGHPQYDSLSGQNVVLIPQAASASAGRLDLYPDEYTVEDRSHALQKRLTVYSGGNLHKDIDA
jgi:hypothetical protein